MQGVDTDNADPGATGTKRPYKSALLQKHASAEFPSADDIQNLVDEAASAADGPGKILEATSELKARLDFGLARKILKCARDQFPDNVKITQQLALCTYKDEELHAITRFSTALGYLQEIGLGDLGEADSETHALGGAVYKRKWEFGGQVEDLYQSLYHYRAAFERDPDSDMGYGAVNAAYALDILASRARLSARRAGVESAEAKRYAAEAKDLREKVIALLSGLVGTANPYAENNAKYEETDWFAVTLAEAHFGLEAYEDAKEWLATARDLTPDEWKRETAFRQLVNIARLKDIPLPTDPNDPESWELPWQTLQSFLGDETAQALSCYRGKTGLGLSGGGFRASFFHIGVLARLAEIGALRHIDVLSTVSGGSIVGAHYYLEVQNLLKRKADRDIGAQDYIEIVARLEERFFKGVERNIRMRVLSNLIDNIRMILSKNRSRTHRLGELYESELYAHIENEAARTKPRYMSDLLVRPRGLPPGERFNPKLSNWRRAAKVPILLLNTASLNSGHNWRFTATWMGEPPTPHSGEIDKNERYRRLYYRQAAREEHKNFRLGHAVGASSCVPGLFEPLAIHDLYPAGRVVQLVDGGVHDNQGIHGLVDEGCDLIILSDASGQMANDPTPSNGILGVPLRSNSILMDRVREAQHDGLQARLYAGALQGMLFLHLKKDLANPPVDWIESNDPTPEREPKPTTPYDMPTKMQRLLADMRTDLDSFTEVEAYSLMLSGYRMAKEEIEKLQKQHVEDGKPGTWGSFDVHAPTAKGWRFLDVENFLPGGQDHSSLRWKDIFRQLEIAKSIPFKAWMRSGVLKVVLIALAIAAVAILGWLIVRFWDQQASSITYGEIIVAAALGIAVILWPALSWLAPKKVLRDWILKISLATVGWVISIIHLRIFDGIFKRLGRLARLRRLG